MNKLVFLIFLLLISCGQTFNSNSGDAKFAITTCADPSNTTLFNATLVLADRCINCHTGYHDKWANYCTNNDWVNAGEVLPGNSAGSLLIKILKQNAGGTMPKNQPKIPDTEYQTLIQWIDGI
ncbi:MAG: hypothetical protein HN509_12630 [Halobacteriovoraceae bacterium]|jgi:hypothetical protein|nr:hypothetical protein [Halobacteriovoraceae bacterium]MBT5095867.1 hypothetical protein [Halobacteriovoraceae bacterium]